MNLRTILLLFLLLPVALKAQRDRAVGFLYGFDLCYDFDDKLLQAGVTRKATAAVSFANDDATFVTFLGAGFKGWKVSLVTPQLQESFLTDVKTNYHPVAGFNNDSLVGASMYNLANGVEHYYTYGHYSQYLETGFIFPANLVKPSFTFHIGIAQHLLYTPLLFSLHKDNPDYEYATMQSSFWEVKGGISLLPFPALREKNFTVNLVAGYKHVNYGDISYDGVPVSRYTSGNLDGKYGRSGKFTAGITFLMWNNW